MSGPPFTMSKYASEAELLRDKCAWLEAELAAATNRFSEGIGWIPVGERLPDQRRRSVLVHCAERKNSYTAYLDEEDPSALSPWRHFGGDGGFVHGVTHWMPLPEPPK